MAGRRPGDATWASDAERPDLDGCWLDLGGCNWTELDCNVGGLMARDARGLDLMDWSWTRAWSWAR